MKEAAETTPLSETCGAVCGARCSAPSTVIIDRVVQLGFAMIPRGRSAASSALTSGTTSGNRSVTA